MAGFAVSPGELSMLWDAITDEPDGVFPVTSDGKRRWAWLVNLSARWVTEGFDGFAGAIIIAEDGHGPIVASLYESDRELAAAWDRVFAERIPAVP